MPAQSISFNDAVRRWGVKNLGFLKSRGRELGITHRSDSPSKGESLTKLKDRYGMDATGQINRVSFTTINRSLIYTTVGAGKGIGGAKGSRWFDKYGNRKKTNPDSLGKLGTKNRKAKPFIDQVLEGKEGVEELADITAEHQADAIISSVYLK